MAKSSKKKSKKPEIGSVFDLLSKSVDIVKKNWQVFAVVNFLTVLGAIGDIGKRDSFIKHQDIYSSFGNFEGLSGYQIATLLGVGLSLITLLAAVGFLFYTMSISLQVKATAGKKPSVSELFNDGKRYFFPLLGLTILTGLILIVGFALLIVPGVIALGRLIMAPYYLMDKKLGVVEALKLSNEKAKDKMSLIYAAFGVSVLIAIIASIVGVIPIIGPLAGVAITVAYSLVIPLRYQQLKKIK